MYVFLRLGTDGSRTKGPDTRGAHSSRGYSARAAAILVRIPQPQMKIPRASLSEMEVEVSRDAR